MAATAMTSASVAVASVVRLGKPAAVEAGSRLVALGALPRRAAAARFRADCTGRACGIRGDFAGVAAPPVVPRQAPPQRAFRATPVVAAGSGLPIDLRGKRAFIAGVADDAGFGWAIARALAEAGAEIIVGTWVPALNIFETNLRRGKLDESRKLSDGSMFDIAKVYPLDAVYDTPEDVPEDVRTNKRYAAYPNFSVQECVEAVKADYGTIDILVHSLANGPEVAKPLLETSRKGYLAASSASAYSFVSLVQRFAPIMPAGSSVLSLTYIASESVIPGYGGGMSSAKAALESDTRVLAWEAGRKYGIRVNTISAGPLASRAAKAIGFIDDMIKYSQANAPITDPLYAEDVGKAAAFIVSPLASAITGVVLYVDNGLHAMGLAINSPSLSAAVSAPATGPKEQVPTPAA